MREYLKIWICILLVLGGAGLAFSSGQAAVESKATPLIISWYNKPEITAQNDRVLAELERRTNTKITFITTPKANYIDKLQLMVASGSQPDIMCTIDPFLYRTILDNWIRDGIIIPFNDEMQKVSPELVKIYANKNVSYYSELKANSKIYLFPVYWDVNSSHPNNWLWHMRKDMLDKLGLQVPNSLDDIEKAMIAAKSKLGVFGVTSIFGIDTVGCASGAFGLPYKGWVKDPNGGYAYSMVQPGMKEAVRWWKKLFDEGLVEPAILSDSLDVAEQKYYAGKTMFIIDQGGSHITGLNDGIVKTDPNGQNWMLAAPVGPDGKRGYTIEPGFGKVTVVSNKCKTPVEAARFMNYLVTQDGQMLTCYGIKGVDYTQDGSGNISLLDGARKNDMQNHWSSLYIGQHQLGTGLVTWADQSVQDWFNLRGRSNDYVDWYKKMFYGNQSQYLVNNEMMVTVTPKWAAFQQKSQDLTSDYFGKMLTGQLPVDQGFAEYAKVWNESGGADAQKEMSDAKAASLR